MSTQGKDSATPAEPFTMNSTTFSLGTPPAGQGDLTTAAAPASPAPAPATTASDTTTTAVTAQLGNLTLPPKEGDDSDEQFPAGVIARLIGLKQLQEEYETLDEQYKAERVALEKKYFDLRSPILTKRSDVVNGKIDLELETAEGETVADSSAIKGIPGFWLQCLANHHTISSLLGEQDAPALEALTDIKLEYNDDYSSFKLIFTFASNDYFTNEVLTKSYTVSPDLLDDTAPNLTSVNGTIIEWKEKKNLCETEIKKKQKSKKGGQTRYVTQMVPKQSFFHYFGDPHMGDEDDEEEESVPKGGTGEDHQQKHEFQLSVDADYEIGHMFRTEIIPSAILWFTGEADGGDDFDDDEEDEDGDDEGEGDEDEEDEEDPAEESEEVEPTRHGKSRKGKGGNATGSNTGGSGSAGGAGGAAGEQPECKQS